MAEDNGQGGNFGNPQQYSEAGQMSPTKFQPDDKRTIDAARKGGEASPAKFDSASGHDAGMRSHEND